MHHLFENVANYCQEVYGAQMFKEDNVITGFICPNCGELVYSEDWTDGDTDNWTKCPICGEFFGETEE